MKYKSELIHEILEQRGHEVPNLHYQSECVESWIDESKGAYPKLCDYESEWLNYINENPIGEFPYETVTTNNTATVNHVVPLAYKSAILTGQTLVNLVVNSSIEKTIGNSSGTEAKYDYIYQLENNKDYTIQFEISNFNATKPISCSFDSGWGGIDNITIDKNGIYKTKFTANRESTQVWFFWPTINWEDGNSATVKNIIVLEGDHTQKDIPYFTSIQSVKMPVLKTTGKNLIQQMTFKTSGDRNISNESIKVTKGVTYTLSFSSGFIDTALSLTRNNTSLPPIPTENENVVQNLIGFSNYSSVSFTAVESGEFYLHFRGNVTETSESLSNSNIQLEESSVATSYEPYKSNILTVNEEVELRGIGDVRDELDLLTGEVTERIDEFVLDGSENWVISDYTRPNHLRVYMEQKKFEPNKNVINSRFADIGDVQNRDVEGVYITNTIDIQVEHSRLSEVSLDGFKNWLRENNIKVQAILSQESIKTVDLTVVNQDGEPLSKIKPIEGTMHVEASGTPINPTAVLEVPVEAITQNLNSFIEGD